MKFLRDLTLGQYLPGASPVHRLDPRAKLVACVLAMITVFLPSRTWGLVCAWPLLAVGFGASRIPLGYFARGIRPFAWLFAFTLILHGLTVPGQSLLRLPSLSVDLTAEGLTRGAWVSAQLATAIAFSSLLTLTTNPVDLVWALERLGSPLARLGVPVGDFCAATLMGLQSLPILSQETDRLITTLRTQGGDPTAGPFTQRLRNLTPLLVLLFRQVFQRAESLARDMERDGLQPGVGRASWRVGGLGVHEAAAVGGALLVVGTALGLGLYGSSR
jgi:energy-coupling factor transport system permease protein